MGLPQWEIPPALSLNRWEEPIVDENLLSRKCQVVLAGILAQYSALNDCSCQMFETILDCSSKNVGLMGVLNERISHLESTIDNLKAGSTAENSLKSKSHRAGVAPDIAVSQQLFTSSSMHPSIREAYERSAPPPAFHLLDPYVHDGKPALSKYTNPDFFLERWAEEEQKKFEELKADWRRRRLIAKKKKQAQAEATNATVKPVTKLKKLCYDPLTGELIVDKEEEAASLFPELQREELPGQRLSRRDFDEGALRKVGPKSPASAKPVRAKSRRTMEKGGTLRKEIEEKPLDEFEAAIKPSVSDMLKSDLEKTPGSPSINVNRVAPPPEAPSLPVETPVQKISKPPAPTAIVEPAFPPAPPPPLNTTQFAPLVQEPAPVLDQENQFTDALKSANASLKPTVYPEIEKPTDTRSTLLESIRSGLKNNLRSAQERVIPAKMESEKPPTSVAEILARRVAIEFYSDEEDIDSSDWTE